MQIVPSRRAGCIYSLQLLRTILSGVIIMVCVHADCFSMIYNMG